MQKPAKIPPRLVQTRRQTKLEVQKAMARLNLAGDSNSLYYSSSAMLILEEVQKTKGCGAHEELTSCFPQILHGEQCPALSLEPLHASRCNLQLLR